MSKYIVTEDNVLLGRSYLTKNEVIDVTEEEAEAIGDGIRKLTDDDLAKMKADAKAITDKSDLVALIKDLKTQLANKRQDLQTAKAVAARYAAVVDDGIEGIKVIEDDLADAEKALETDNTEDDQAALDKAAEKQRLADEEAKAAEEAAEIEKQRIAEKQRLADEEAKAAEIERQDVAKDREEQEELAAQEKEQDTDLGAAPSAAKAKAKAKAKKKRGLFGGRNKG